MKTLFILRHAKAVPDDGCDDDHARPLNERGREAASAMGGYMRRQGYQPSLALCSTSARTCETLDALVKNLAAPPKETLFEKQLYLASAGTLLHLITSAPDAHESLMIVGHNPGMHMISLDLAHHDGSDPYLRLRENFPTCALAVLHFEADSWHEVAPGEGTLLNYMAPKLLG